MQSSLKKAVYPGTFDPVTLGHIDVIERALKIFDKLTIAVTTNPTKKPAFSLTERVKLIQENVTDFKNVEVKSFDSLLVDFVKKEGASTIVRGLREISDFEAEFKLATLNRKLAPNIDTFFVMTNARYFYLSSSVVKEVASHKGELSCFVPKNVEIALKKKFK